MPQSGATPQNKGREVAQLLEEKENQKKRTFEGGMMDGPTMAEEERNHQRNKKLTASIATGNLFTKDQLRSLLGLCLHGHKSVYLLQLKWQ